MLAHLYYGYRIVATGSSFALFGIGGLVTGLTLFPLLNCLPGDRLTKERRAQRLVHLMFRGFVGFLQLLWVAKVEVHQQQQLARATGTLIIANHPSLLDVVILIASVPHTNCIVKESLFHNPFTRFVLKGAGYIANNDPEQVISACEQRLRCGDNLIIFPEGTRTTPGRPLKLQRGTARIMLRSKPPVIPVIIDCTPTTLTKGTPWYQVAPRRFTLTLSVAAPWRYPIAQHLPESRQVRQLTRAIATKFNQELSINESIRTTN
ncbi:lysophospholipid acyltransferase family protein [Ferrimonas senticii]|uniref:lysophospholipid acyltransferase family protein n=1 Tax=Ferrimonas senticii TaxID=394566 RepID=UPI00040B0267|nr:lysophospholipid acyltransferase family protein [Ferrimonas senticii]